MMNSELLDSPAVDPGEPDWDAVRKGYAEMGPDECRDPFAEDVDPDLVAECENAYTDDADRYAEWIARKFADAERAIAVASRTANERVAELTAEIMRLIDRNAERTAPLTRNLEYLHGRYDEVLKGYAAAKVTGKSRTVKLLYATLSFRKNPDSLNVLDDDAAIEWSRQNAPAAIKTSILKTPLKKYVQDTGEIPPGCEYVVGEDTFAIKTEEARA
jgi:phage host-nuclease inhibitor protein Gam